MTVASDIPNCGWLTFDVQELLTRVGQGVLTDS
jgi:hypothetical protein